MGAVVWYVGVVSLFLTILVSVTFVILSWRTSEEVERVRAEIEAKKSPEILLLESEMRNHRRRVIDFAHILSERISPDSMVTVIERSIHPEVYLSDLQIDVVGRTIRTSGVAANITAFDQQRSIFERDEMIASSGISTFTRRDDGRVSFPIAITFSDRLFNSDDSQ